MNRPGYALVFSVLLVMALSLVSLGMLAVGTREAASAHALTRKAVADLRAEDAVRRGLSGWSTREVADLPVGGVQPLGAGLRTVRLEPELFLLEGVGEVPGPGGGVEGRAAALVRVVDPAAIEGAFPAALSAREVRLTGGTVTGLGPCGAAPGIRAQGVHGNGTTDGEPALSPGAPPPVPPLLEPGPARALADVEVAARTVSPRPWAQGECRPAPRNWGALDPGHPCYDLRPLVVSGDLTLAGGQLRGILVVDGDLRITGQARVHGLVVVHGRLEVTDGASVRGAVRARSADIRGGHLQWDGCVVADAASAPALDQAFRPEGRWWIPAF